MTSLRLFVALPLPEPITAQLVAFQGCLKRALPEAPLRLSRPQQLHLTLYFLGHTPEGALAVINRDLRQITQRSTPFSLALGEFGAFPSLKRPSVLWCGVTGDLTALSALQRQLSHALDTSRNPETQAFKPHLTLARLKQAGFGEAIASAAGACELHPDCWTVDTVVLYRSLLRPDGAVYEVLQRHPLGQ
jgi:2'-5' RNA ligase